MWNFLKQLFYITHDNQMQNKYSKNLAKFSKKNLCWSLFLIKLQILDLQIFKKDTSAQVFCC